MIRNVSDLLTMLRRRLDRHAILVAILVLCSACPQKVAIAVGSNSTVQSLHFIISDKIGGRKPIAMAIFMVGRCGVDDLGPGNAVWFIEGESGSVETNVVTYGIAPAKFKVIHAPERLGPGCYFAKTSGARTEFQVEADGRVH